MNTSFAVTLVWLPVMALALGSVALFVWIIRFVYQDANSRGMNGALWAALVFILQLPIGPIVYFIARKTEKRVICPYCSQPVETNYPHCPHCGEQLKGECPECGAPVEDGWRVCSRCGERLSQQQAWRPTTTVPEEGGEKKLLYLIIASIVVPVLIVMLLIGLGTTMFLMP